MGCFLVCVVLLVQPAEEEEDEDFSVLPSDNLLVIGRAEEDFSSVEVHGMDWRESEGGERGGEGEGGEREEGIEREWRRRREKREGDDGKSEFFLLFFF